MYPFQWALTLLSRPSSRAIGLCRAQKWGGGKALIEGSELKLHLPAACLTCKPQLLTKFRFCLWGRTISVCPTIFSFTASLGFESGQEPAPDHTLCLFWSCEERLHWCKNFRARWRFPRFLCVPLKSLSQIQINKSVFQNCRTSQLCFNQGGPVLPKN